MQTSPPDYFPTRYWHKLEDGRVCCDVCPRKCTLREGKRGACFVRMHRQGEIVLTSYGRSSGFCIDPIEKKPLNHFHPGSSVLSFGTAGCNLSCQFCQNWDISKSREFDTLCDTAMPDELAQTALKYGCKSLAFTYNDPVVFMEYAIDAAVAARNLGLKSVAVSAGYICEEPREEFYRHMDAANIDLKGFTEHFYHKICHGHLQPVLETLLYLKKETDVWFEITTLLIPGENDSEAELNAMCHWIFENLGANVPLHFSAFHPDFKMLDKGRTPLSTLLRARDIALSHGLHFVYCGNVHDPDSDATYCPSCGKPIIERDWYQLGEYHLDDTGHCNHCGHKIPGRFAGPRENFGPRRIPVAIHRR
ncbi:AmmeMemoRadiSam system radical SAM enzyme [Vibrio natriegens]|uniref:AmmeMemoRadiSam system radical SAM enzyme n=1 Tax=Vibrio natriegens TaxID=691 RepID=UPI003F84A3E0